MAEWEIWLDDAEGLRLEMLDQAAGIQVTRVANGMGSFALVLPGDYDDSLLQVDGMVEFWRRSEGGALSWVSVGIIRQKRYFEINNTEYVEISGRDHMDYLKRRIVA